MFIWRGFAFVPLWLKLSRKGQILGTRLQITSCFSEFPCKSLDILISGVLFSTTLHKSCWWNKPSPYYLADVGLTLRALLLLLISNFILTLPVISMTQTLNFTKNGSCFIDLFFVSSLQVIFNLLGTLDYFPQLCTKVDL